MKITLVKVSRPAHSELTGLVDTYLKRIRPFCQIESEILKSPSDSKTTQDMLAGILKNKPFLVLLEETGKELSSKEFSQKLNGWLEDPAIKHITICIGGPFGFSDEVKNAANFKWSLSKGTFQGDIAWLITAEQLYRAFTLIKSIPYHH